MATLTPIHRGALRESASVERHRVAGARPFEVCGRLLVGAERLDRIDAWPGEPAAAAGNVWR